MKTILSIETGVLWEKIVHDSAANYRLSNASVPQMCLASVQIIIADLKKHVFHLLILSLIIHRHRGKN